MAGLGVKRKGRVAGDERETDSRRSTAWPLLRWMVDWRGGLFEFLGVRVGEKVADQRLHARGSQPDVSHVFPCGGAEVAAEFELEKFAEDLDATQAPKGSGTEAIW